MGDMQEALKAHDAWMEDVSQSLQEAHERASALGQDILTLRDQSQAKLDGKPDVTVWQERNEELEAHNRTVRDMVSTLRIDVDNRRRTVDDGLTRARDDLRRLEERTDRTVQDIYAKIAEEDQILHQRLENQNNAHDMLNSQHSETGEALRRSLDKLDATKKLLEQQLGDSERALRQELADK